MLREATALVQTKAPLYIPSPHPLDAYFAVAVSHSRSLARRLKQMTHE